MYLAVLTLEEILREKGIIEDNQYTGNDSIKEDYLNSNLISFLQNYKTDYLEYEPEENEQELKEQKETELEELSVLNQKIEKIKSELYSMESDISKAVAWNYEALYIESVIDQITKPSCK